MVPARRQAGWEGARGYIFVPSRGLARGERSVLARIFGFIRGLARCELRIGKLPVVVLDRIVLEIEGSPVTICVFEVLTELVLDRK